MNLVDWWSQFLIFWASPWTQLIIKNNIFSVTLDTVNLKKFECHPGRSQLPRVILENLF